MKFRDSALCSCVCFLIASVPFVANAQWQPDGIPVCTATDDQELPTIVTDGSGGAIIAWQDYRDGAPDIFAQRIAAIGAPLWFPNGVRLTTVNTTQIAPMAVADGTGGAIVAWLDDRNGFSARDVYAQRIDMDGAVQWTADGLPVCVATSEQRGLVIVSDNAGGAIIAWSDERTGSRRVYAQRLNSLGAPQWTVDGVAVSTAVGDQEEVAMAPDGAGGAVLAWILRLIPSTIYAQRLDATGAPLWTTDGVDISATESAEPAIVSDGTGGAIVAWRADLFGSLGSHIWSQRIDAAGIVQWAGGTDVAASGDVPQLVSDEAGGAIATWVHYEEGDSLHTNGDIHAQRLSAGGVKQWLPDNMVVTDAPGQQDHIAAVPDFAGGVMIAWVNNREGTVDIYAQRLTDAGVKAWTTPDGVPVCTAEYPQEEPAIVGAGVGAAIIAWHDKRGGDDRRDIYAQQVTSSANAVAITSFDALTRDGVVELQGTFRSDLGVEAINVYRARGTTSDPFVLIDHVDEPQSEGFEYVDRHVIPSHTYRYMIGVQDADGEFFSPAVTITVREIAGWLGQNQPNPFNPTTTIQFVLPSRDHVRLAIYAPDGRLVRTLLSDVRSQGRSEAAWDGRDDHGAMVGSGVYFYQLRAGNFIESRKMVLLK